MIWHPKVTFRYHEAYVLFEVIYSRQCIAMIACTNIDYPFVQLVLYDDSSDLLSQHAASERASPGRASICSDVVYLMLLGSALQQSYARMRNALQFLQQLSQHRAGRGVKPPSLQRPMAAAYDIFRKISVRSTTFIMSRLNL